MIVHDPDIFSYNNVGRWIKGLNLDVAGTSNVSIAITHRVNLFD